MNSAELFNCGHRPKWQVNYDIGNGLSERMNVCDNCYSDIRNDCFRLYEIQKILINNKKSLEHEAKLSAGSSSSITIVDGAMIE